jgi:hypothetical protein
MKIMKLDLNLDLSKIDEKFLITDPTPEQLQFYNNAMMEWQKEQKGEKPAKPTNKITPDKLVSNILEISLHSTRPQGNKEVLKRTQTIIDCLENAIEGISTIGIDDFKYLRSAFDKADKWNNNKDTADLILAVDELLNKAQEVDI